MIFYLIMCIRVKVIKFALLLLCAGLRTSSESLTSVIKSFVYIQDSCLMPSW